MSNSASMNGAPTACSTVSCLRVTTDSQSEMTRRPPIQVASPESPPPATFPHQPDMGTPNLVPSDHDTTIRSNVSSRSASAAGLSQRMRLMRGKRMAMPLLCRAEG